MALLHASTIRAGWEPVAPLPEPKAGFVAACIGGKIVIAGGTNWKDDVKRWLDEVHVFDPAINQWHAGPKLPHPVAYAAFGSDGARLFFAGGADGVRGRKEIYALDANLQLTKLGELPQPVVYAGGVIHDGKLCMLGGSPDPDDWNQVTPEWRSVDLASGKLNTLPSLALLGHGLGIPAMVMAKDRAFVFTGAWLDPATQEVGNLANAFRFDFSANSWRAIAPFYKPVRGLNEIALDDRHIYLAGGYGTDEEEFLGDAFLYDVETDRYTAAKPMPFRSLSCLVQCGGFVYALGGEDKKKHRTDQCWRIRVEDLK